MKKSTWRNRENIKKSRVNNYEKKGFWKEFDEQETLERLKTKTGTEKLKKVNKIDENKRVRGKQ